MELFRSRDMKYVAITMTNEAAHATVREVGKVGKLHMVDLSMSDHGQPSRSFQHYKKRVIDIQALERKLTQLRQQFDVYQVPLPDHPIHDIHGAHADIVEACRETIEPVEQDLVTSVTFLTENRNSMSDLRERLAVMMALKSGKLDGALTRGSPNVVRSANEPGLSLDAVDIESSSSSLLPPQQQSQQAQQSQQSQQPQLDDQKLRSVVVGTIPATQQVLFSRMLYRVSRGNALVQFAALETPLVDRDTGALVDKVVFTVMLIGQQITQRVQRMCESLRATLYSMPTDRDAWTNELKRIKYELDDKQTVEQKTEENIRALLHKLGENEHEHSCPLRDWLAALAVERVVCSALMKAHFYLTMITIEGWVPVDDIRAIKQACKLAVAGTGNPPAAIEVDPSNPIRFPAQPPTYYKLNRLTETFQGIVDTYGVPRYKEANPALFTVISFPFLFGVMYGDIGHGILLTLFSGSMVYWEDKLLALQRRGQLGEIPTMAFGGRYIMLLMGMFAIYCGSIYNDCMSIPLNVYGSRWSAVDGSSALVNLDKSTYPYGVDPGWSHRSNSLAFYNSLKMKMAVIFGVVQMTFGIFISLSNHLYFKDEVSVYYEFLPRLVFLLSTFGYMCWMILYKWCQDWALSPTPAPNIITTMINMFLSIGTVDANKQLYSGQAGFQTFLVLCAVISVPIMLFGKPYANKARNEKKHAAQRLLSQGAQRNPWDDEEVALDEGASAAAAAAAEHGEGASGASAAASAASSSSSSHHQHEEIHEDHSFSDEMIHNAIHTIEFVLGCVSNTASYLRLWALSLAHAQLADVFWSKMIQQYGIENNALMAFIGFAVWFGATFAVLLCMDVLECFLHALRLHWVEFQSKFYYADGIAFDPFALESTDPLYL